jgi:hypothetical protein
MTTVFRPDYEDLGTGGYSPANRSDRRSVLTTDSRSKVGTHQKTVPTLTRFSGFLAPIPIHFALEKQGFEGHPKGIRKASSLYGTEGRLLVRAARFWPPFGVLTQRVGDSHKRLSFPIA